MPTTAEKIAAVSDLRKRAEQKAAAERDEFITARTQHEQILESLEEAAKGLSPDMLKKLKVPKDLSCKAMFPSLYKDTFILENYKKERVPYDELKQRFLTEADTLATTIIEDLENYLDGDDNAE